MIPSSHRQAKNLPGLATFALAAGALALAEMPTLESRPNAEIIVDRAAPSIFPESWLTPRINASAERVDASHQESCRDIVARALTLYPASVVKANLKHVYVLGRLAYSHNYTGGSNSKRDVYVVRNERISDDLFENNFHAEFSSILLRNYPHHLDAPAWHAINPSGFSYRWTGSRAVANGQASVQLSDRLHEDGFLNEYGMASIEEDFNSYAARLFTGDSKLWRALEKFPKVKAKTDLAMSFYRKLDASFTQDFFHSRRQPETK